MKAFLSRIKRSIFRTVYYKIAVRLTQSSDKRFWGCVAKKLRARCAAEFLTFVGKDVNIEKGAMITSTMEIGDRLYGVTMPERGISRVIPINMNEVESKKKELLDGVL